MKRRDVRYWPKADIGTALHMSAFGGKADIVLSAVDRPYLRKLLANLRGGSAPETHTVS